MTAVITHSVSAGGVVDATAAVDGAAWDANHVITGVMDPSQGGTGVANNNASTIAISGAFGTTFTVTAATGITLPTTGTLATLAGAEALTNKTYNGNTWTAGTGVLTIAAAKTATFSNTLTFTGTDASSVAFGAGGTVLYNGGALGTPSSGTLTNCTGLPVATGISGLGANVASALQNTVNSASGLVTFSGVLGTPTSGTLTNCTGLPLAGLTLTAPLIVPQVRVTLTTGVAVTTADVAGATSIFASVSNGSLIPIWDGSKMVQWPMSGDLTLALDSNSGHTNYHQSGKNYDLYSIGDSGTLRLGTGPKWDDGAVAGSATARGTGAGSTDIQLKNGLWTNTNTITIRFGSASGNTVSVAANCATYLGTFRATADGQASDTVLKRLLFNAYQIAQRYGLLTEASTNWNYSTAAFQQVNASAGNQIEVLFGLPSVLVTADAFNVVQNSTATARTVVSGIGIDSSTVNSARSTLVQCVSTPITTSNSTYKGYPGLGWHEIRWLERGNGTDTQTWYGNNAGAAVHRSGMQLEFWG